MVGCGLAIVLVFVGELCSGWFAIGGGCLKSVGENSGFDSGGSVCRVVVGVIDVGGIKGGN